MSHLVRSSIVTGSTLAIAMMIAAPAAVADDVTDLLDRTRDATYTATRVTVSVWGDHTSVIKERVEHAKGNEMIRVDETWRMVGNGRAMVMDDAPSGLAFLMDAEPAPADRYEIGEARSVSHMRRTCSLVPILEDGSVRARVLVDDRTGAPLITYVYDGDGRAFRTVSLSDFAPHRTYEWPQDRTEGALDIVMHDPSDAVPEEVAGYELVDAFPGPSGSEQGFYSDGLFAFSLFVMSPTTIVQGFDDPAVLATDRGTYDLIPAARDVRVHWSSGDAHWVLVGDLPPDHLDEVLAELPAPGQMNVIERLWRRLFG